MSNALMPFAFGDNLVRVINDENGNPWFVAKDVALALGYEWNGAARIVHVPEEWRGVTSVVTPRGGTQEMLTLSEQGMYFFLNRSDKPGALPFQKWLAGEVLPALRRTGSYTMPGSVSRASMLVYLENLPDAARYLRPNVRSKVLWCAMKVAEMDNSGVEGVMRNFTAFCRMVGEAPHSQEGQLLAFMEECLTSEAGVRSPAHRIYNALRFWWRQQGKGPLPSEKMLSTVLDSRFAKKKSNTVMYLDCAIRREWRRTAQLPKEGSVM